MGISVGLAEAAENAGEQTFLQIFLYHAPTGLQVPLISEFGREGSAVLLREGVWYLVRQDYCPAALLSTCCCCCCSTLMYADAVHHLRKDQKLGKKVCTRLEKPLIKSKES